MKPPFATAWTYVRAALRRWLRHTWISRLPLGGSFRTWYRRSRTKRSPRRLQPSFRPVLEGLEGREVPGSVLDVLAAPALVASLGQNNDDLASNTTALLNSTPPSQADKGPTASLSNPSLAADIESQWQQMLQALTTDWNQDIQLVGQQLAAAENTSLGQNEEQTDHPNASKSGNSANGFDPLFNNAGPTVSNAGKQPGLNNSSSTPPANNGSNVSKMAGAGGGGGGGGGGTSTRNPSGGGGAPGSGGSANLQLPSPIELQQMTSGSNVGTPTPSTPPSVGGGGTNGAPGQQSQTNTAGNSVNITLPPGGSPSASSSSSMSFAPMDLPSSGQTIPQTASTTSLTTSNSSVAPGQNVTFTATVSGDGGTPTGTVAFYDGSTYLGSGTLGVNNGQNQATFTTADLAVGSHTIVATYSGDATFAASTASIAESVASSVTSLSLSSSSSSVTPGQSLTLTATVSVVSGSGTPTGSVTFYNGSTQLGSGTLNSSGVATFTTSSLTNGSQNLLAVYSGDDAYAGSVGALTQAVNVAASTTALTSSVNPSTSSQSVTFTATVTGSSGMPTGSVTFYNGTSVLDTVTLNGSGVATYTNSTLANGSYNISAIYSGDSTYASSNASLTQQVGQSLAASAATLTSSANPAQAGQSVTFTATVTGDSGTPTGMVTFYNGTSVVGSATLSSGVATYTTSSLPVGSLNITALYGGDGTYSGSTAAQTQTVNLAVSTTTLTSSASSSLAGQSVTFTATVSGSDDTPTGSVIFYNGSSALDTVTLVNGVATYNTSALSVGSLNITALYNGNTLYASSNTSLMQQVGQTASTTTLTSSASSSLAGQSVTFTATVSGSDGTPTGSVTFYDGSSVLSSYVMLVNGVATCTTSSLPVGSLNITAIYSGNTPYASSNASLTQQVAQTAGTTTLTSSDSSSLAGQSVTFTATVNGSDGTPTGSVTFYDGSSVLSSYVMLVNGVATCTTSSLPVGSLNITALYSGNTTYASSNDSLTQQVAQTSSTTSLTSSANPSQSGQSVTFTATVSGSDGTPTGSVTFYDGSSVLSSYVMLVNGVATCTTSSLPVGSLNITAIYSGNTTYASSNDSLTQQVAQTSSTTSLTSSANPSQSGQSVTFTATVSGSDGTPTGSVTFYDGSSVLSSYVMLVNGVATCTTSSLPVGSLNISAIYSGNTPYASSNASLTQQVGQSSATSNTTLTSSDSSSLAGQSVTFTATVSGSDGTPTGSVTFYDGSSVLSSYVMLVNGVATCTTSSLPVGSLNISAIYSGNTPYASSNASLTQQVAQTASTTTLTSSNSSSVAGQSVTFTATVNGSDGTPTGYVTFYDGSSVLSSYVMLVNGVATYTTSSLPVGSLNISAIYSGNTPYASSNASLTQQVAQTASTTTLTSSASSSVAGQSVTFTATVSGSDGTPTGSVTFYDGSSVLSSYVMLVNGVATYTTSSLPVGSLNISAIYSGNTPYASSNASLTQQVAQTASTTTLTSSASSSVAGQSVTFTATVSGSDGTPTGSVYFYNGGNLLDTVELNNGVATCTTSSLPVGSLNISAIYGGNTPYTSSNASLTQQVAQTASTTTLTSSNSSSVAGQSVTFTATVSGSDGTPTGSVYFYNGGNLLDMVELNNGVATYTTSSLSVGSRDIIAIYNGNTPYASSTASLTQQVEQTASTTSLASSANPSQSGQSLTLTATVTGSDGTPTGTVTFYKGSSVLDTMTLSNGEATYTTSSLPVGNLDITAIYSGNTPYASSTASLTQQVEQTAASTTLTSSANPSSAGQSVTFAATVGGSDGTPTGSVTFYAGASVLGTETLSSGVASYTTSSLAYGNNNIVAIYNGSSTYTASTAALMQQVVLAACTASLSSSVNPALPGQPVTFTDTISGGSGGTPTGSVTFYDESTSLGSSSLNAQGQASVTVSNLALGAHNITAVYSGNSVYVSNSATLPSSALQNVNQGSASEQLTSSANPSLPGQAVTFTDTLTGSPSGGTPTGTVDFYDGQTLLDSETLAVVSGADQASFTDTDLSAGQHDIVALYSGDATYANGEAALTQTVLAATSTSLGTPTVSGSTTSVTVTVQPQAPIQGTPTGSVSLYNGSTLLASQQLPSGEDQVTFSVTTPSGTPVYRAVYGGDANFATSQASLTPKITYPPVTSTGGQSFSGSVGSFIDADGNIDPTQYTATINWGDQQSSSGTVSYSSSTGTFQINGTHTYDESGSYTITATVTDQDGSTFTVVNTAYVQAAQLTGTPAGSLQAVQGSIFQSTLGSFTDGNPTDVVGDYQATVNWGDGSTTTGLISDSGPFTVTGSHVYQQIGSYTVEVTVTDQGGASTTFDDQVTVSAPTLPYVAGSPTFVEGAAPTTQNLATFTDASGNTDPDQYSATIDWGDDTSESDGTIVYLGNNTFQISGSHGYAEEGDDALTITLTDNATDYTETIPVAVTVSDAPLTATPLSLNADAGSYFSGTVANFTDANPYASSSDFTATINWGDNSSTALDGGMVESNDDGGFAVDGGHTYSTAGNYNVTVTIDDEGGATATTTSTIDVAAPAQTLDIDDPDFTEGQEFDGAVATYVPPSGSSGSYTATIGWGDGSVTSGTLTANDDGSYTISGTHTYTEATPSDQPYTLTVAVQPAAGTSGTPLTNSADVTVADAPLTPTPLNLTGWTDTPTGDLVVGQFSDANPYASASDFTASIDWGDDSTSTIGTVQVNPDGGFQVVGNHTYTEDGDYDVTITVTDEGGSTTNIDSTITVTTPTIGITATEGDPFDGVVGTFSGNVNDVTGATITWGDGNESDGTVSGDSSTFTVSGTNTYLDEGTYPLSVTVEMSQGGPLTASGPAIVNDAALTATGVNLTVTNGQPLGQVVVANFTDANPYATVSDFTATIDWGDGNTSEGTVQQNGDSWQVLGDHTYANAGSYTAAVTIDDVDGSTATADSTVTTTLVEGQDYALALQLAAPMADNDSDGTSYTATIDWGDGSEPTTGTVSVVSGSSPLQLLVTGDHVYTEAGDYTFSVTVTDANGNESSASTDLTVVDAPLTSYGLNVSGTAGVNTGTVTLGGFTDQNTYASADDYSVSIDWGDDSGSDDETGAIDGLSAGSFQVTGDHTYAAAGTYTVTTTVTEDDGGATTTFTSTATVVAAWSMVGSLTGQRTNDPNNADLQSIGEATVDLNQGALRLSAALDFDQSPGSDVGGDPALVYNSATVNVLPVIQLAVQGDAGSTAPTQAVVQLTWNGVAQTPVTYTLDQPAGSVYLFGVQPDSPVGTSGVYDWSATVTFSIPGQDDEQAATSGTAYVVSNAGSAYGAGWSIDGISQLVVGSTGAMMVTGEGDSEFFAANGNGGFISPANDFGTLVQNADGSYTYTAVDQTQYNYNSLGYLTSVVDTHGLATTYTYDDENRLIQVTASDGGVTTLSYDATTGLLDSITEPGNRTLTLVHDSYGNITQITDVDGTTRSFGYADGGNHLITEDQWDPLDATFSYNTATNQLTQVNLGLGSVYTIVSAASDGLGTSAATGAAWASITDGDGDTTKYLLDSMGRLLEEVEPDGTSTYQYVLNAAGLPIVSIDPMGRVTLDSYDAYGDLLQETEADGSWTQYQYDPTFHEVTATLNSMGQTTSNTYDPVTGDLLTSTDAMGAVTTYTYYQTDGISNGLVYSVTTPDENGTATSYYYYDADRRLIESVDPMGIPTYYTYDANGNPLTTTDAYGQTTTTVYSPRGFLLESIDALGAVTSYTYDAYGLQTSTTDARGFTSTTTYDQRGWQTAQTDDMGVIIEEDTYDAAGDLLSQTDADGNTTDFVYNADGDQVETIYPDGTSSSETFDADGEVVSSTDEMGLITTYAYNSMGEEVSTTDPMGRTTTAEYDSDGDVIRITDPMGLSTLDFYNADGEEIASSQQVSGTVWATDTTQYDLAGDEISSTDAMGLTTTYNYNADGEEISSTDPDGNTSTNVYDLDGNLIRSTDADGNVTTYAYNADGELISSTDPDGNVTQTVYDADGNVIATIGPNGTTTTTYNGDDEAIASTDADGNVTQMVYDKDGNEIESIDPTGAITRTWYNNMDEAVLSEDPDGNFSQTVYNGDGEVVATAAGAGDVTQNAYDADGEETSTRDGDGDVTQFAYNADGQQISETDADGKTTQYVMDALGDTVATVDPLGNVTQSAYNLDGLLVSTTDADGRTSSYQYDNDGNLLLQVDGAGDTSSYAYDGDGNQTLAIQGYGTSAASTTVWQYDGDGNVTLEIDGAGNSISCAYDGAGNQTLVVTGFNTPNAETTSYAYDSDGNLTLMVSGYGTASAESSSYGYDGNGNQTLMITGYGTANAETTTATYDGDNELIQQVDGAGNTTTFSYDALGDQIASILGAGSGSASTTTSQYDGDGNVTLTVDGAGDSTSYAYDGDGNLTLVVSGYGTASAETTSYAYDSDGNQTLMVSGYGTASAESTSYGYDANGNQTLMITGYGTANAETTTAQYDSDNELIQQVDGAGNTTTFSYDALGDQIASVLGAGSGSASTTTSQYDGDGNVTLTVDGAGDSTSYAYDSNGNQTLVVTGYGTASAETTSYAYDSDGNQTLMVSGYGTASAESTSYGYDANGNQTLMISGYGTANAETTTATYDGDNELIQQVDGAGNTTTFSYDALGDQIASVLGAGSGSASTTTSQYDGDGNVTLTVDGAGDSTSYAYDSNGNQTLVVTGYGTANAETTSYAYDSDGNQTLMISGYGSASAESTSYGYDGNGNQTLMITGYGTANAETTTASYDGDNELIQQVDGAGNTTMFSYDSLGDQIATVLGAGSGSASTTTSQYDGDGNVTLTVDGAGDSTSYAYDSNGNQTLVVTGYGTANAETTSYAYDSDGNQTLMISGYGSASAESTSYGYDANGNQTLMISGYGTANAETTTASYDGDNELIQQVDGAGNTTMFSYDSLGDQIATVLGAGSGSASTTTSQYDGDGNVTLTVDGAGDSTSYAYDSNGNEILMVTGYGTANAETTSYAYDSDGNQTLMVSGYGSASAESTSYGYDGNGNQTLMITGYGTANAETTTATYDGDNELIQQVDGAGNTTMFSYDSLGDQIATVLGAGSGSASTTTSQYDGDGNVTLTVDGAGDSTSYAYDSNGNEILMVTGYGTANAETTSYAYDSDGNQTLMVSGYGSASAESTSYGYDGNGNQTLMITGYGTANAETTTASYDGDNELIQQVDGAGNTTMFSYDSLGDQIATVLGAGSGSASTTTSQYDGDGNVTLTVDGAGDSTSYAYDSNGNEILMVTGYGTANAETTSYAYDSDGNQTLMISGYGSASAESTSYGYDANGNQTLMITGYGTANAETTTASYDGDNELIQQVDGAGNTTTYRYDARGDQIVSVAGAGSSDPGTTSNFYDGDGNLTLTVNPVGDSTSYAYDADGNQTLVISGYGTTAAATVQYVYDANGNVLEEIDPDNNTTSYAYDADGNQTLMIQAYGTSSAATTTYQYDGDGNLIGQGNPNGTSLSMSYDADGNLISELWYAGSTVTNSIRYTYDGDGNILTAGNDAGTYTFTYNADGEETSVVNPNGVTLNYQYDADGNATQITDSLGDTVTSQYDADGDLLSRGYSGPNGAQLLVQLGYDGDGNLTSISRYADLAGTQLVGTSSYAYNTQGDVTNIVSSNAADTVLDSFNYSYDAADELTQEVDNGTTTAYSYDATGQLVSAGTTSYAYDANGNPDQTGDSVGPNNELLTDGTWNYSYDANGNMTGKVGVSGGSDAGLTWAYAYDAANELLSATETNSQGQTLVQETFTYDVFGNMLESSLSTNGDAPVVTSYVYNNSTLWTTTTATNVPETFYLSGDQPDQYFAQYDASNGAAWYLTNNLGSVCTTMNNAGQDIDDTVYDAYGNVISQSNAAQQPGIGYDGYQTFAALGLDAAGIRDYDPQSEQWMQEDPELLQPGPNSREYVNDEPTNATDPTGMEPYALHWHHLLPQDVFTPEVLKALGLSGKVNIDDAHWGYFVHQKNHQGGVHAGVTDWNDEMQAWVDKRVAAIKKGTAGPVTVEELNKLVDDMIGSDKYKKYYTGAGNEKQSRADQWSTKDGKKYATYQDWRKTHGTLEEYKANKIREYTEELKRQPELFDRGMTIEQLAEQRAELATQAEKERREARTAKAKATRAAPQAPKSKTPANVQKTIQFGTVLAILFGAQQVKGLASGLTHYKDQEPELEAILQRYNAARNLKDEDQIRVALYELTQSIHAYLEKLGNEPNATSLLKVVDYYRILGKEIKVGSLPPLTTVTPPSQGAISSAYTNLEYQYNFIKGEVSGSKSSVGATISGNAGQLQFRLVPSKDEHATDYKKPYLVMFAKGANMPPGIYYVSFKITVSGGLSARNSDSSNNGISVVGRYGNGEQMFYAPRNEFGAPAYTKEFTARFTFKGGRLPAIPIVEVSAFGLASTQAVGVTVSISDVEYTYQRLLDRGSWESL